MRGEAPDGVDRWLILQTLIGTGPITEQRLAAYLEKAMREAKRHSNWEKPDEAYEGGVQAFAKAVLARDAALPFDVNTPACVVGIAQTILQLTIPGNPDIYQGTEFWDHTLVDPDNRRPFDWHARREALEGRWPQTLAEDHVGASKIRVMQRLLALRRSRPELFHGSDYAPLAFADSSHRWIGYERRSTSGASLLVAVPTRTTGLGDSGSAPVAITGLPGGAWDDVIRGGEIRIPGDGPHTVIGAWPYVVAVRA